MKKNMFFLALCFCALPLFSDNFFFEKIDPEDDEAVYWEVDINNVRTMYRNELFTFINLFFKMTYACEKENENLPDVDWGKDTERVGVWQDTELMLSGYSNRFVIYPDNRMEYYTSQMDDMTILHGVTGAYSIKKSMLEFRVNEIMYWMPLTFNVIDHSGYISWDSVTVNKIRLERPFVYRFPVSDISTVSVSIDPYSDDMEQMQKVTIGEQSFYRVRKDPDRKH